jgi:hypothetical protein
MAFSFFFRVENTSYNRKEGYRGRSMKVERYINIYKRYNNKNIFIKAFNYLRYVFGFMSNEETGNYYWYTLWKKTNKS